MTFASAAPAPAASLRGDLAAAVAFCAGLTALRLVMLRFAALELDFEEAQYWSWSRDFAFGYFSKPPLIAWIIGAAQAACGAGEACLRAPAALIHGVTAFLCFLLGRRLYGPAAGLVAMAFVALSPGAAFSARLITTDVPLLAAWTAALLALLALRDRPTLARGAALGAIAGLGVLAKYAMLYAVPCALVAAALDAGLRRALLSRAGLAALGAMLLVVAPNIAWNAVNDFHTLAHTGENVSGGGVRLDPMKGLEFVGSQFGIAWGVALAAAIARAFGYARDPEHASADRLLLAFSLPVLVPMALYAFAVRANPNWAAPALVSAMILGAAILVRAGWRRLVIATIAAGVVVQLALFAGDALAWRVSSPLLPKREPYARALGWAAMAREVEAARRASGARTVATDQRAEAALFTYYLRDQPAPVRIWREREGAGNQFELAAPLTAAAPGPVLLVTGCPRTGRLERAYAAVRPLGPRTVATGETTRRTMLLFLLEGPRAELPPVGPCE